MSKRLHLFQGFGIELEYMIVDRDTLDVKPISDELLKEALGNYGEEYDNGSVSWSNELVLHVLELKCSSPTPDLIQLEYDLHQNIIEVNERLKKFNARLMPTAAHPWMDPKKETFLWPHGNSEIYEKYNQLFDCQGHGWSNLQSTHLNLPFYDDEEFAKLHTAARLILPIIPGLTASSPILGGVYTDYHDRRMVYYKNNQRRFDSITGKVVPEGVTSRHQYQKQIYERIAKQIKPYDPENILDPVWVNSRGIIARFDRGSIEIRIVDIQESPKADLAILALIIHTIRLFVEGKLTDYHVQHEVEVEPLYALLKKCIKKSSDAIIDDKNYLKALGMDQEKVSVIEIWKHFSDLSLKHYPERMKHWVNPLNQIFEHGSLAKRILNVTNGQYTRENLKLIYQELSQNLEENKIFEPCDTSIPL
ncbi:carboxylate-amine ligase [Ekhidna sp.]|uniref:carboxylate-amine ligase n=1 Tax=Ekhidna sp. TaxID=2608089 RepID=UPI003C7C66D3